MEATGIEDMFIAEKLAPMLTVPTKAGIYPYFAIAAGNLMKKESTLRDPSGTYNEVTQAFTTDTYETMDRGLETRVDDSFAADWSRFFEAEVIATQHITRSMKIDYEYRVAQLFMGTAGVTAFGATDAAVAYTELLMDTIDFARDVNDAKARLVKKGVRPNTMVMSLNVYNRIRRTKKLQNYLFGAEGLTAVGYKQVDPQRIGSAFSIQNVYVAEAHYDSADKGQATATIIPIWGDSYVWIGYVAGGDFQARGAARTIVWTGDSPSLYVTESYRDENRRSDKIRVRHHTSEKIIDSTAGTLITTGYA
jgi:hypothetical protein